MNAIALPVGDMICHLGQTHAGKSRGTQEGSQKHTDAEIVFPKVRRSSVRDRQLNMRNANIGKSAWRFDVISNFRRGDF